MYLKSLVLKGFKSFADRSVLSFEPGVTAIVGPNGSGKSNISDSVLWVLGERNAKNLRGQAMEDVIFAGSSARKPVGVAEVELVLDNQDGTLPVDFAEVSLMRRMYRNGESEYLINGTQARRMDVLDILHDSGLGTGTHSIISQGHLSSILQSKPEDRRALIEEAAGVLKHKQRKEKSERKLAQMDVHLTRVQDIVAEVERQVKPLERKAKRALAYRDVADELAKLNLDLAVDDLRVLQGSWNEVVEREKQLGERLQELRDDIAAKESAAEELQTNLQAQNADAGAVAQRYRRAQTALDRLDSNVLLLHERKRSTQSYLAEMRLSLEGYERTSFELEEERAQAEQAANAARLAEADAKQSMDAAQQNVDELEQRRRSIQSEIDAVTHRRRDALREMEEVRAAQAQTQEIVASNRAHEKLIGSHAEQLAARISQAAAQADQAAKAASGKADALASLKEADAAIRTKVGTALTARDSSRAALDAAHDAWARLSAQVTGLEELERARQAENPLLAWAIEHAAEVESSVKPLIDAVDVPSDLAPLVEDLLGSDLSALLVRDAHSAAMVAERLQRHDALGAVTIVPQATSSRTGLDCTGESRLVDQLTFSDETSGAVEALLGDVVLCNNAAEAIEKSRTLPGACCATRAGLIVWGNGKITCTHHGEEDASALASHRSLEEARTALAQAETERHNAEAACEAGEQALRDAQTESLRISQEFAQAQGASDAARDEAQRAAQALEALNSESESLEAQRATAREALAKAEPDAAALDARLQSLTAETDESKEKLDALREALAPVRTAAEEATADLSEAKLSHATCAERASYAQRMLSSRVQDQTSARERAEQAKGNIYRKQAAMDRIDPLLGIFNALADAAKARTQQLEQLTAESQSSSAGMHARINEARAAARAAHDAYDGANEQLADVRVEKGRLEMQVESAIGTITQECGTPLETALELPALEDRPQIEERAFKLRRRIANMGTINPDAAAEYEELKARFDYLSAQLEDMLAARRSLARIVRVIDARMKDDFVNTFDEVNRNYQEIFGLLFPGGSGSLSLVDPDDPENTGVEVNAQPNGKRILKMSLMSGGEQSLTAMALLFAVYRTRSTPFYILDEVEAALDDTNLRRLCAYLNSMRDGTQFIMITHQRRTMEMADVLYGISMQADGVTKVVSQRLDKALRYAES